MKRRWLLGGVVGLVVAIVVTLVVVAPAKRVSGEAVAADPADAAAQALDQLAGLDDVELTGWVRTATAQRLHADIVATKDGAQAIVRDEAAGLAEFVVDGDRAAIKANAAWWLNTVPAYQQDFSDKWVKADDSMGFPVSALADLSGDRIRARLADRAADADWTATPVVFQDGRPAMALSLGAAPADQDDAEDPGWRVFVTPTDPPGLLGIGGPLLAKVDRLVGQPDGRGYPDVEFATTRPTTSCRDQADKKVEETAPTIPDLPRPEVPDVDERPELQGQVLAPGGVCMSPVCPFTVRLMNVGNAPGVGTVMITSSSGPPMTAPLNLPPGGQFSTVYNAPNPAPPSPNGRVTVSIIVQAFAQVTSLAGPDIDAGKRLNDRGVDPNNPMPGKPAAMGPGITDILDRLTSNAPLVGVRKQDVVADAERVLGAALDAGLATLLRQLVSSPALRYANDSARTPLLDLFTKAARGKPLEQAVALRTLKLLAALTNGKPAPATADTAPVHVEANGVVVDDTTKHAYAVGGLRGGLKGQQGVDGLYDEIERARGLLDEDGVVPPGYPKVVDVTIRGAEPDTLGIRNRSQLRDVLRDARPKGRPFADVLLADDGTPAVNGLTIISPTSGLPGRGAQGGAFVFDGADLTALGQKKDEHLPEVPPESIDPHFTPYTSQHTFEGDASDPNDSTGGGHGYGVGAADKTEYPKSWTRPVVDERAVEVVNRAIANKRAGNANDGDTTTADGTTIGPPQDNKNQMDVEVGSWQVHGTSNGIELEITLLQDGTIVSAYPTGNVADKNGLLQPYDTIADPANPELPYLNPSKPPGKPRAELPQPGNPGKTKDYAVQQPERPQYRRVGADGKPEWVYRGEAKPGGPKQTGVPVEVTRDQNGRHKKTTKKAPPKPADPPPMVCRPTT